jgi:hypothetical protein
MHSKVIAKTRGRGRFPKTAYARLCARGRSPEPSNIARLLYGRLDRNQARDRVKANVLTIGAEQCELTSSAGSGRCT